MISGRILVRVPGSRAFKLLDGSQSIPAGSTIDATKGHLSLTSAKAPTGDATETVELYGGVFAVRAAGERQADLRSWT